MRAENAQFYISAIFLCFYIGYVKIDGLLLTRFPVRSFLPPRVSTRFFFLERKLQKSARQRKGNRIRDGATNGVKEPWNGITSRITPGRSLNPNTTLEKAFASGLLKAAPLNPPARDPSKQCAVIKIICSIYKLKYLISKYSARYPVNIGSPILGFAMVFASFRFSYLLFLEKIFITSIFFI